MATIRATKQVPIDTIRPHPENPNQGDVGALTQSLKHHGQYRAIVVSEATGNIVAGNHTYLAAKANGETKILAHLIPDLSLEDEKRIMVADNQYARLATSDDALLVELLTELAKSQDGLIATGYDGDDLDTMLADLQRDDAGREGDTVEPPAEPTTKLGDVWALGEHRLTCGDAFDVILQGDCIVTDPPYGMRLDTDYTQMPETTIKSKKYRPVIGDDEDFDPTPLFARYADVKEQLWFGGDYYRQHLPPGGSWMVWDKRDTGDEFTTQSSDRLIGSQFELIWTRTPRHRTILRYLWAGFKATEGRTDPRTHPTQKPIALMEHLIRLTDGIVLDPFAGSGTTLIAADNLGRVCHAVELDPAYCDVIVKRWESLSPDHHADLMG